MSSSTSPIHDFNEEVVTKFQIYDGIFMTLPFDTIYDTGSLLPLFAKACKEGYQKKKSPLEIVEYFSNRFLPDCDENEQLVILARFIQYIERQVVLFDALEDAAFNTINNLEGRGSVSYLKEKVEAQNLRDEFASFLERSSVRPVLTAHPTQFYPGTVLGIITDLTESIRENDVVKIRELLAQLGKTTFVNESKPSPYDEAVSLIWYLEHIFYTVISKIYKRLKPYIPDGSRIVQVGFWPGGDRDGNPFVTTEITRNVALRLRQTLLRNYYRDVRTIARRITFKDVYPAILTLKERLLRAQSVQGELDFTAQDLEGSLIRIKEIIVNRHQGLYVELVDDLIIKVRLFGLHFGVLDIRQDSSVHDQAIEELINQIEPDSHQNYLKLDDNDKIEYLKKLDTESISPVADSTLGQVMETIQTLADVQQLITPDGCHRYIISNSQRASHVYELFTLIASKLGSDAQVDITPLFETVPDLKNARDIMELLYSDQSYREHLKKRGNKQYVMLGFSDGTKDGGYLMANWAIYKAKQELTTISRAYDIEIVFFDGRGGPPARGGGMTHKFYASLGPKIEAKEIQLTIQGQTISSKFGNLSSCQYNLEQLLSSSAENSFFKQGFGDIPADHVDTIEQISELSYQAYTDFKNHPKFLPYLENVSTLRYYAQTNIGSRPSKRGNSTGLNFKDLRAIPFVGSWSLLKQNVPGFYGLGYALESMDKRGEWDKVVACYKSSKFLQALLDNSEMSMAKSYFPLTAYMEKDPEYGAFWKMIYEEFERAKMYILRLSNHHKLMSHEPVMEASIRQREKIVLPLLTIQQFALMKLNNADSNQRDLYEKLVLRSLFGNINASRNSA